MKKIIRWFLVMLPAILYLHVPALAAAESVMLPNTGDRSGPFRILAIILLVIAAVVIVAMIVRSSKNKK